MAKKPDIKYVCPKCNTSEFIAQDVIDFFDTIDPDRALIGPPAFQCETCGYLYMLPEGYNP